MINLKASTIEPTPLDDAITRLFDSLQGMEPDSDEYAKTADQLVKLYKLNDESKSKKRVSPDTLANLIGSLSGIVTILVFEKSGHIIATKALGFVTKLAR
ncbi:hypothetical protein SEA_PHERRYCRUZ_25 [Streptomyces phage PherryCruz]|nr:hypothetical protein SEA_RAVENPUFF_25 [Streptomyces phage RavenPuff]QBZ73452.1 hypothetical protein SEA_PHERRYCRUZ_25 [Streptomyces phage PherryCruz]